jgi:uncharacterized protein YoxC
MSAGEIAGLIAAVAFVLLVGLIAIPLLKLGRVLDETTKLVSGVTEETVPLLKEVTTTVTTTQGSLVRVEAIASDAQTVTANTAALSSVLAATLGGPMVKVAAFSYGVRQALSARREIGRQVRADVRADRRAARRARRGA